MKVKSVFSAAMAVLMAASVVGCGSNSASKGGDTWKIGVIGPLTGDAAAYGLAVKNAAELAAEEINAKGGINGKKIEILSADDELDAQKSVNAYNALKDKGMQILNGTVTTGCCLSVIAETKKDNMFQMTPSGSGEECVKYDNVYRMCFSDPNQGTASAKYIKENGLGTKIGVIYDNSDAYSSGIYDTFKKEAKENGLEIVSAEAFNADNKTDFTVQLTKAKEAGADLVFLPIYYSQAALILKQASDMNYKPTFFGCDGMDGILGVENFDTSLAEGLMLLTPFAADAKDELTQNFVKNYNEKYNGVPNQFAADSYDTIYAIKAAIEKANITPDKSVSEIGDALKGVMSQVSISGLTSDSITWDASGEPNKNPKAVVIKDGAYVSCD